MAVKIEQRSGGEIVVAGGAGGIAQSDCAKGCDLTADVDNWIQRGNITDASNKIIRAKAEYNSCCTNEGFGENCGLNCVTFNPPQKNGKPTNIDLDPSTPPPDDINIISPPPSTPAGTNNRDAGCDSPSGAKAASCARAFLRTALEETKKIEAAKEKIKQNDLRRARCKQGCGAGTNTGGGIAGTTNLSANSNQYPYNRDTLVEVGKTILQAEFDYLLSIKKLENEYKQLPVNIPNPSSDKLSY